MTVRRKQAEATSRVWEGFAEVLFSFGLELAIIIKTHDSLRCPSGRYTANDGPPHRRTRHSHYNRVCKGAKQFGVKGRPQGPFSSGVVFLESRMGGVFEIQPEIFQLRVLH